GTMASPQIAIQNRVLTKGQKTASRVQPSTANQHGSIMNRTDRMKNRLQQFRRNFCLYLRARLDVIINGNIPLNYYESANTFLREGDNTLGDFFDNLGFFRR